MRVQSAGETGEIGEAVGGRTREGARERGIGVLQRPHSRDARQLAAVAGGDPLEHGGAIAGQLKVMATGQQREAHSGQRVLLGRGGHGHVALTSQTRRGKLGFERPADPATLAQHTGPCAIEHCGERKVHESHRPALVDERVAGMHIAVQDSRIVQLDVRLNESATEPEERRTRGAVGLTQSRRHRIDGLPRHPRQREPRGRCAGQVRGDHAWSPGAARLQHLENVSLAAQQPERLIGGTRPHHFHCDALGVVGRAVHIGVVERLQRVLHPPSPERRSGAEQRTVRRGRGVRGGHEVPRVAQLPQHGIGLGQHLRGVRRAAHRVQQHRFGHRRGFAERLEQLGRVRAHHESAPPMPRPAQHDVVIVCAEGCPQLRRQGAHR